jgi:hypothetical protein
MEEHAKFNSPLMGRVVLGTGWERHREEGLQLRTAASEGT